MLSQIDGRGYTRHYIERSIRPVTIQTDKFIEITRDIEDDNLIVQAKSSLPVTSHLRDLQEYIDPRD